MARSVAARTDHRKVLPSLTKKTPMNEEEKIEHFFLYMFGKPTQIEDIEKRRYGVHEHCDS
jgi:hypothetical protein